MTYPINRPTKHALRALEEAGAAEVLGNAVLRAIRNGEVFVATPDDLDTHTLYLGLREPTPPRLTEHPPKDRVSILPWLTAAVL